MLLFSSFIWHAEAPKVKEAIPTESNEKDILDEAEEVDGKNEQGDETESTITGTSELKDDSNMKSGEDNMVNNFLNEVLSTDYLQRKIHCAVCPKRFWSQQDLKRHMKTHTGKSWYGKWFNNI